MELDGYNPIGPFLYEGRLNDRFDVEGATVFREPWGDPIPLDIAEYLPGEEVISQSWAYGWDEEPFIVGMAEVRTPASGMTPEKSMLSLLRISPSNPDDIVARVDIDAGWSSGLAGAAPGAVVVVSHMPDSYTRTMMGVQLREGGGVVWSVDDGRDFQGSSLAWRGGEPPETVVGLFEYSSDGLCGDGSYVHAVDLSNGAEIWRQSTTVDGECAVRFSGISLDPRYADFLEYLSSEGDFNERQTRLTTRSLVTGAVVDVTPFGQPMEFDLVGPTAWVEPREYSSADGEVQLYRFVDLETGESLFTMEESLVDALDFQVRSILDGRAYVSTTDESLIIDVRTGEELGIWSTHPVELIGTAVVMSDDTLHSETP